MAVASVCVSSSHLIQPSASLLKRNSLCNLKDKTNVSAFCSVNAKGVSHTQVNGSIFLKSVLKLYFKHFYFTVIVVCVKINCPGTLERTSGCLEVSEASSYPVFVLFSKMTLECIMLVMQQCHFYFKTLSFLQPVCEGCRPTAGILDSRLFICVSSLECLCTGTHWDSLGPGGGLNVKLVVASLL